MPSTSSQSFDLKRFQAFVETRQHQITPHVATIHDLCGYGNCSLGIAMPVLSAGGIDANAVPTSVLSCHTAFPEFTFLDTTSELPQYFENWERIGVPLDGAYTGFLGSLEQIDMIVRFFDRWPDLRIVIDPVMGDHGRAYQTYTPEMCQAMKRLVPYADVLTPNLTEAAILLDEPFEGQARSTEDGEAICRKLQAWGAKNVVLKGMERELGVYNGILDAEGSYSEVMNERHLVSLHGTGDLFASILTAALFTGHQLVPSVAFAGRMVYEAIVISTRQEGYQVRGVTFEPLMGKIAAFCQSDAHSL